MIFTNIVPHTETRNFNEFAVYTIPILEDNFSYIIVDDSTSECALVDPAEPNVLEQKINELKKTNPRLKLKYVLTTHKHWDHAGGNATIHKLHPDVEIVGGSHDHIQHCTKPVNDNDELHIGKNVKIKVKFSPCHTSGHVLYHVFNPEDAAHGALFTGDTLISGGCGKFFEGTAGQMYKNLYETIGLLSNQTVVFCGHNYSVSNLEFDTWAEPLNEEIKRRLEFAKEQAKKKSRFSYEATVEIEKKTNVFMRCNEKTLQEKFQEADPIKLLAMLRKAKDDKLHQK